MEEFKGVFIGLGISIVLWAVVGVLIYYNII